MAKGKAYDPALKAKVIARIQAGEKPADVAKSFKLDKSTVSRWSAQAATILETLPEKRQHDLGTLLEEHLVLMITAMNAQLRKFCDPEWLRRQDAHGMAILFGVEQDKLVRLLGAKQRADSAKDASQTEELPSVHPERPQNQDER